MPVRALLQSMADAHADRVHFLSAPGAGLRWWPIRHHFMAFIICAHVALLAFWAYRFVLAQRHALPRRAAQPAHCNTKQHNELAERRAHDRQSAPRGGLHQLLVGTLERMDRDLHRYPTAEALLWGVWVASMPGNALQGWVACPGLPPGLTTNAIAACCNKGHAGAGGHVQPADHRGSPHARSTARTSGPQAFPAA